MSLRGRQHDPPTMDERISHYASRVICDPETGCWLWQGKRRTDNGYAVVCINYKDRLLHQVMYEHFYGSRPKGTNLHHTCETKHCVYPKHLELLPIADHVRLHPEGMRAAYQASAARRRAATHCKRGHEFTEENTYWRNGCRTCIACTRLTRERRRSS